ncbi:hypothetical protein B7Y94_05450 [Candidatus Saccharibacteria bacterium 32-49-12]|nr:MAG: hypothetical protein B7Y94_05450 [Candidatus Saccharibacteria bacterium 32-49-12]
MQTTFLSKQGFKELRREIRQLEGEEKTLINQIRELGRVKSRDDKLQRSDLVSALELVQAKLLTLRQNLQNAKPMPRKRDRLRVAIGSVVDLVDQQGRLFRYTIVDSLEANPSDGRISAESPLGQQLLNRQKSESISWQLGTRPRTLRLVDIH